MTFAPLGGKKGGKPLAIILHEALCGRYEEDIASTYVKFVKYLGVITGILHCGLTIVVPKTKIGHYLLFYVNPHMIQPTHDSATSTHTCSATLCERITLKYFEPGHTYMAAMRKKKNVLDFRDCINARGIAIAMLPDDFYHFKI